MIQIFSSSVTFWYAKNNIRNRQENIELVKKEFFKDIKKNSVRKHVISYLFKYTMAKNIE